MTGVMPYFFLDQLNLPLPFFYFSIHIFWAMTKNKNHKKM